MAIGVQGCRRGMVTADDTVLDARRRADRTGDCRGGAGARRQGLRHRYCRRAAAHRGRSRRDADSRRRRAAASVCCDITNGEGMPVVMEATGATSAMELTIDLVAAGGRIVILGLVKKGQGSQFPRARLHAQGSDHPRLARLASTVSRRASTCSLPARSTIPKIASSFALSEAPDVFADLADNPIGPAQGRIRSGGRMKLVTFSHRNGRHKRHAGMLTAIDVSCLTEAGIAATMMEIVDRRRRNASGASATGVAKAPRYPLADLILEAPIRPGKVLCSGINYKGHAEENPNAKMPTEPFFFAKLPTSVVGPEVQVVNRRASEQMDYEVEFSAVIGKRLHQADEAEVMPAIFGYTLLNDISARDVQFKDNQITLGKNFAGFAPIGPCIVTADELTASRQRRAEDPAQRQDAAERQHLGLAVLAAAADFVPVAVHDARARRHRLDRNAGRRRRLPEAADLHEGRRRGRDRGRRHRHSQNPDRRGMSDGGRARSGSG